MLEVVTGSGQFHIISKHSLLLLLLFIYSQDDGKPSHIGKESGPAPFTIFSDTSEKKPVKSDPFTIFSDEAESAPKKQETKPCQPFAIFSDAEVGVCIF